MAEIRLDEVTLAFDDTGGDLPPLVLIHGLSGSRATWGRMLPDLSARFRVYRFDQRGHGESSHVPDTYTLAHYVPDAVKFCERVVGQPAVVAGHSLGGVVAAVAGRERPDLVRGAFLEDPPLFRGADSQPGERGVSRMFPIMHRVLTDMRARNAPYEEYEAMIANAPAMNGAGTMRDAFGDEGARAHASALHGVDPEVFTAAIDGRSLAGADPDEPIACPVHVLRSDPDLGAAFTPEDEARFLETNPNTTVELVAGASHAIHDEQPHRFLDSLFAFAERLGG